MVSSLMPIVFCAVVEILACNHNGRIIAYWSTSGPHNTSLAWKASKKCFHLPGLPTSTSSDGQLSIFTTLGGSTKLHQKKINQADRTTTGLKEKKMINESDDETLLYCSSARWLTGLLMCWCRSSLANDPTGANRCIAVLFKVQSTLNTLVARRWWPMRKAQ